MKQFDMFEQADEQNISGLRYIENYITPMEESALIGIIDKQEWNTELKRRVQHYGYKYDYKSKKLDHYYLGSIPNWLTSLCNRLLNEGIFHILPDQVIVNEYLPGQGIAPHIDCIPCFGYTVCSLSLGSTCVMELTKSVLTRRYLLEPRSLLILSDEARYLWRHSIIARKQDRYDGFVIERKRRVSLTFRKVLP